MKTISRAITMTVTAGIFVTLFVSKAIAGCGDLPICKAPSSSCEGEFGFSACQKPRRSRPGRHRAVLAAASMVGFWKTSIYIQRQHRPHPSIPDGALIDFGLTQWHSDGTEIHNSAGIPDGGFCLGVWGQTGLPDIRAQPFSDRVQPDHRGIANFINLKEQDTLSPSGDSYVGTFTEDFYDTKGNHVDHLAGAVLATRLTVDSSLPTAEPNQ